jgi:hypothetical protein
MRYSFFSIPLVFIFISIISVAQINLDNSLIRKHKPPFSSIFRHIDLDKDGDPDLLYSTIFDSIPIIWIDDDDDMKISDREGDLDNDCLIIDRNNDGTYAGPGDLSIDWVDTNNDGIADMQVVVENTRTDVKSYWDWSSNYMWIIDQEQDETFHYVYWKELVLKCWAHYGASHFYEDYHGQTLFQKAHLPSYRFSDLRYSWENPFLFYDIDDDGLSEVAIRLEDSGRFDKEKSKDNTSVDTYPTAMIDHVYMGFDMDNDNAPSNEFDFDMGIRFSGEGFSYASQVHQFENMRGLPAADSLFFDKRWREMNELIYTDHDSAWDFVFNKGKWDECWLVFDEDDDCERWERVEFYQPLDPFKIGMNKGGIDNNPQADASGDRGEWDMDNSGKGNLYIGFDGKIHLYGAERGFWRIDQDAWSYQGWGGLYEDGYRRDQKEPIKFPTIAYEDTNADGFFNLIKYDLDGDTIYELEFDLTAYGITPNYKVVETAKLDQVSINKLFEQAAEQSWQHAMAAVNAAKSANINYKWYTQYLHPKSINEKYQYAWWLKFYLFNDFLEMSKREKDNGLKEKVVQAYFSGEWSIIYVK